MSEIYKSTSIEDTRACSSSFAKKLRRGDVVALYGELGSGKTQFVKGICKAFNVVTEATSPSFVILNRYEGKDPSGNEQLLYHFDLYRIKSYNEIYDIGYEEYLQGNGICLIEWADVIKELLPERRYDVRFSLGTKENERQIEINEIEMK